jgi:ribonuclease G
LAKDIIADVGPEDTKVALLEDDELIELFIEKTEPVDLAGNVYRGKVSNVLPGMQAAFIDIGYEKNAFLYIDDVSFHTYSAEDDEEDFQDTRKGSINELLKPGQEITVQIVKEPTGSKGPRATTHISLPGRYLVLLPGYNYIGISHRIESEQERNRLRKILEKIKPKNMGFIVRTASEGKEAEDFKHDLAFLIKLWHSIKKKEKRGKVPRCIHKDPGLIYRTVRDLFTTDIDKFIINNKEQHAKVVELAGMISPALKKRVRYEARYGSLFEHFDINAKISKAFARKVWLKCGGYIIIDHTEALTVIDVNTGKYVGGSTLEETVLKANIEAAGEVAKQIRLRDLGGIIIIDFIDMRENAHRQALIEALRQELKKDRSKTTVVGMTGLGLIEMTRKRVRLDLASSIAIDCEFCKGTGKIPTC